MQIMSDSQKLAMFSPPFGWDGSRMEQRSELPAALPEPCFRYFLRRSFRTTYTTPMPLASRARLDGSGTETRVAPAKAAVVAVQIARSDIRESGTRRVIG